MIPEDKVIIELCSELKDIDIYYTFDNTDPDKYTHKYVAPLHIPKDATWLKVVTYRNGVQVGKIITLTMEEIRKRAQSDKRPVIGNLTQN
ncbi:MAG: chitobiase/beta-hexosaminidase C-terminal domain-containing protein [Odoribacter sp.]|nr:chitobiase/beta-hexosaminidase C-terminal domain-containing protein [Odoribacter sp.]